MELPEIDPRLQEVARRLAPQRPPTSPAFAAAVLRAVAAVGVSAPRPAAHEDVVLPARLSLLEGERAERVSCRITAGDRHRVVTVEDRLGVQVTLGEAPRLVGVMVLRPHRADTLEALSVTCRLGDDGPAAYEWRFGRRGRIYVVRARHEDAGWKATVDRVLSPIESGVVDPRVTWQVGLTPADAFERVVGQMPRPKIAVADARPRHGLGDLADV